MPTYTQNLEITHLAPGQSQKDVTVDDALDALDIALSTLAKSLPDSDYTLTNAPSTDAAAAEATYGILVFSGALTSDRNVVFPAVKRRWHVINNTSGGHAITCKTSGGTGVAIANGQEGEIRGDGTNIVAVTSAATGSVTMGGDVTGASSAASVVHLHRNCSTVSSATYTEQPGDEVTGVDASSNAVAITLAAATGSKRERTYKKLAATAHPLTIAPDGTDTIDGVNAAITVHDLEAVTLKDYASGKWMVL